jgi:hypothetical protein
MESTADDTQKKGLIPEKEIRGSDADTAYDQEGNFEPNPGQEAHEESADNGSDADTDG